MASFNKVMLMGNLTRDPELRRAGSSSVCQLGLAVNRSYMGSDGQMKDDTCFVDVAVWGKQADSCQQYLTKGSPVFIEGRLRFEQWQDKTSGQNRSKLTVSAERVQFLSSRGSGQAQGGAGQFGSPNAQQQAPSYGQQAPAADNGFAQQQQQAPSYGQQQAAPQQSFQAPPAQAAPQFQPPPMPDFSSNNDVEDDIPF